MIEGPVDEKLHGKPSEPEASPKMCKCGRGPWRKGQRNCRLCNNEANSIYKRKLSAPAAAMRNAINLLKTQG